MRTTLTIEPDVAARLQAVMKRRKLTLKAAVNETLRHGLAKSAAPPAMARFKVKAHPCGGFQPGVDPAKLGQLADDLEAGEFLGRTRG
jgi:hypothetical protein